MQRDAQIGLIIGVLILVAVAVLFFRPDPPLGGERNTASGPADGASTAAAPSPAKPSKLESHPEGNTMGRHRWSAPVHTAGAMRPALPSNGPLRQYTIKEGDTLVGIAREVYGRGSLFPLIYRANERILIDPNHLPAGETITVPEPPPEAP